MPWISAPPATPRRLGRSNAAGIPAFGQGETLAAAGPRRRRPHRHRHQRLDRRLDLIDAGAARPAGARRTPTKPVVAFVHWGSEYVAEPSAARKDAGRRDAAALGLGDHRRTSACGERRRRRRSAAATRPSSIRSAISCSTRPRERVVRRDARNAGVRAGNVLLRAIPLPNFFDMGRGRSKPRAGRLIEDDPIDPATMRPLLAGIIAQLSGAPSVLSVVSIAAGQRFTLRSDASAAVRTFRQVARRRRLPLARSPIVAA